MLLKSFWIAHSKAQLADNGGALVKGCNAAVSDPGASRRASHHKHTILAIVDIQFLASLNVQAIRNTTLAWKSRFQDWLPSLSKPFTKAASNHIQYSLSWEQAWQEGKFLFAFACNHICLVLQISVEALEPDFHGLNSPRILIACLLKWKPHVWGQLAGSRIFCQAIISSANHGLSNSMIDKRPWLAYNRNLSRP